MESRFAVQKNVTILGLPWLDLVQHIVYPAGGIRSILLLAVIHGF
jgi:hypothetical protein